MLILNIAIDQSWLSWVGKELMLHLSKIVCKEKEARMQEDTIEASQAAEAVKEKATRLAQAQSDEV